MSDRFIPQAASTAIELMESLRSRYKPPKTGKAKKTVRERLRAQQPNNDHDKMETALAELRQLRDSTHYRYFSNLEWQRRMTIGTKRGKHDRRMRRSFGITDEEFETYVKEFQTLLRKHSVTPPDAVSLPSSAQGADETALQHPSDISLQSFRDVLCEDGLSGGAAGSERSNCSRPSTAATKSPFRIPRCNFLQNSPCRSAITSWPCPCTTISAAS
eukprot:gb/GECG01012626.1/.p1 GENE.gb/GECG01012626.1/~~gb/GECG01012626.1/.p1  ORF type:complete len:216 (+),score=15.37 gb/GECG01012626.1/:1-648(+)